MKLCEMMWPACSVKIVVTRARGAEGGPLGFLFNKRGERGEKEKRVRERRETETKREKIMGARRHNMQDGAGAQESHRKTKVGKGIEK